MYFYLYKYCVSQRNCPSFDCISRKSGPMPCLKTVLNCLALEHSTVKKKTFEDVLRLNFFFRCPAL